MTKHRKKKPKKKKKVRHQTKHHILPSSRGGDSEDNIVLLPRDWHAIWHHLFGNMTMEEVHHFIDIVMQPNQLWTKQRLLIMIEAIKLGGEWR